MAFEGESMARAAASRSRSVPRPSTWPAPSSRPA